MLNRFDPDRKKSDSIRFELRNFGLDTCLVRIDPGNSNGIFMWVANKWGSGTKKPSTNNFLCLFFPIRLFWWCSDYCAFGGERNKTEGGQKFSEKRLEVLKCLFLSINIWRLFLTLKLFLTQLYICSTYLYFLSIIMCIFTLNVLWKSTIFVRRYITVGSDSLNFAKTFL